MLRFLLSVRTGYTLSLWSIAAQCLMLHQSPAQDGHHGWLLTTIGALFATAMVWMGYTPKLKRTGNKPTYSLYRQLLAGLFLCLFIAFGLCLILMLIQPVISYGHLFGCGGLVAGAVLSGFKALDPLNPNERTH